MSVIAGQEFAKVGLQNCHINSSLPVGTVLQIPFLVWDSGHPPLSATVNRTLVITAPCASGVLLLSRIGLSDELVATVSFCSPDLRCLMHILTEVCATQQHSQ